MDKNYYSEYYSIERNHWWFKVREKIIISELKRNLKKSHNLRILNVGCATGRSTEFLSVFGIVESIEYDYDCCEFVREKLAIKIKHGSITDLPFTDSTFDLVCAFDVIEHVENDQLAVKELERVCNKSGTIFITVPAFMSLWSQHDIINHHYRRYTFKSINKLIKVTGLKKVRMSYFNTFLFIPIFIFRFSAKVIPKRFVRGSSDSDFQIKFQNNFLNNILEKIFKMEIGFLKLTNFPFGVSLFTILKK